MNDANNAGTLLPCPFCGGRANIYKNEVDFVPKWSVGCGDCDANMDVCEDEKSAAAMAWNTRALSTPNAPVEPAGLRSLRHLLAHMPDKDLHLRRFDAQQLLQFIDAILAVRLDEAAIRKDEREKCAKTADAACDNSDKASNPYDGGSGSLGYEAACDDIASAIRNGGKQP